MPAKGSTKYETIHCPNCGTQFTAPACDHRKVCSHQCGVSLRVERQKATRLSRHTVDPDTGCWNWTGRLSTYGYGVVKVDGIAEGAHRFYYRSLVGPIPDGLVLDHLCRNPRCVNPAHVEPVTQAENLFRGESPTHVANRTNVCLQGHPLEGENVMCSNGRRTCRICARARWRRKYARKKARQQAAHDAASRT
jgi:hypothetical protein